MPILATVHDGQQHCHLNDIDLLTRGTDVWVGRWNPSPHLSEDRRHLDLVLELSPPPLLLVDLGPKNPENLQQWRPLRLKRPRLLSCSWCCPSLRPLMSPPAHPPGPATLRVGPDDDYYPKVYIPHHIAHCQRQFRAVHLQLCHHWRGPGPERHPRPRGRRWPGQLDGSFILVRSLACVKTPSLTGLVLPKEPSFSLLAD